MNKAAPYMRNQFRITTEVQCCTIPVIDQLPHFFEGMMTRYSDEEPTLLSRVAILPSHQPKKWILCSFMPPYTVCYSTFCFFIVIWNPVSFLWIILKLPSTNETWMQLNFTWRTIFFLWNIVISLVSFSSHGSILKFDWIVTFWF